MKNFVSQTRTHPTTGVSTPAQDGPQDRNGTVSALTGAGGQIASSGVWTKNASYIYFQDCPAFHILCDHKRQHRENKTEVTFNTGVYHIKKQNISTETAQFPPPRTATDYCKYKPKVLTLRLPCQ